MKSHRLPYSWIINNLTYIQTYVLVALLATLSLLPIGYFWVRTHLNRIHVIDTQLKQVEEALALKKLLFQIRKHRQLAQRYLTKHLDTQIEMETLQEQIQEAWQQVLAKDSPPKSDFSFYQPATFFPNSRKLEMNWNVLRQQVLKLPPEKSELLHNGLINDLLIEFGYLADKLSLDYEARQIEGYESIQSLFFRLPFLQENLSQLVLVAENALNQSTLTTELHNHLSALIYFVDSNLIYLKNILQLHLNRNSRDQEINQSLLNQFQDYENSIADLLSLIENKILNARDFALDIGQLNAKSDVTLSLGLKLWEQSLDNLRQILLEVRHQTWFEMWSAIVLTLLLAALAFFPGLSITHKATTRLSRLTEATNSFTNGNLAIRVPILYSDEIGLQSEAFNRMAQKLEEIINHLYELLDAITALSNGNLTARIQIRTNNNEFNQVAQSFNKMAESFETIIGHLQQIGLTLTTSATEIAVASKEQETIIVEQEATTREIAVAANEISSTAKEFANTMNDISVVAEQTSTLAVTGKDSLSNMESIMRQMVEASSNIAFKLAVLNEKAGNITSVITTITKVADQTNLLSLNASIEAEKAGEYGRSFAVIAREIRRLADQTALSTLDIEKIVNEIMTAVSSSVMGVDDFTQEIRNGVGQVKSVSEQLAKIIEQVQTFTARFELVNQGMQAQSLGAEQINESISQLSQTAQQTSESIHQFHKTIQELNKAANELRILTPFTHTSLKHVTPIDASLSPYPSSPSSSFFSSKDNSNMLESMQQFNQTLNNLNSATNKLKNLSTQIHPFHREEEGSQK